MRAELDELDLERIAKEIEREVQHWVGILGFFILVKLNELETKMSALDDAVARSVASQEALLAAFQATQTSPQGAIDMLNAESDKVDAAVAAVPPVA